MSRYTREGFDKCPSPHDSSPPSMPSNSRTIITHSPPMISRASKVDAQVRPPTSRAIYDESSGFGTKWYINLLSDDLSPQPVSEVLSGPKQQEAAASGSRHYISHAKKSRLSISNASTQSKGQPDKDDVPTLPNNSIPRTSNQNTRGSRCSLDLETAEGLPHVDGLTITEDFMLPFENRQARVSCLVATPCIRSRNNSEKFDIPRTKEFRVTPLESRKIRGMQYGSVSNTKEKSLKYEAAEELSIVSPPTVTEGYTFPLESRNTRPSRFTSNTISLKFEAVESLPQPRDEQKVLASVHYARLELASLRKKRAQDELTIQQLKNRIALEEGRETRRPTADSALGSADEGSQLEEKVSSHGKLITEKNRFEAITQALQSEADKAARDRNSTLVELRVAQSTIEQLKAHNQSLEEINVTLKRNIETILENQVQETTIDTTAGSLVFEESGQSFGYEQEKAQTEIEPNSQRDEEVSQNHEKQFPNQLEVSQSIYDEHSYSQQNFNNYISEERLQQKWWSKEDRRGQLRDGHDRPQEKSTQQREAVHKWTKHNEVIVQRLDHEKHEGLKAGENSKAKETINKMSMTDSQSSSEDVYADPAAASSAGSSDAEEQGPTKDLTYVSALNFGSLRDLRTTIEKERIGRHPRSRALDPDSGHRAVRQSFTTEAVLPDAVLEPNVKDRDNPSHDSKLDITAEDVPTSRKALKPSVEIKESCPHHQSIEHRNFIEKVACSAEGIITVESRYEEEPTIRPSQPPALALASVIQGLEEELSRAKQELRHYQNVYNQQNPTTGKRARHSLKEKMEVFLQDIDVKADYIYSLYDVVEGQKLRSKEEQQDSEAADEMVRLTLESMGIQAAA